MNYSSNNYKNNIFTIVFIIIFCIVIQYFFIDNMMKNTFINKNNIETLHTKENNDILMIEKYYNYFYDDLNKPDSMMIYSFIYSSLCLAINEKNKDDNKQKVIGSGNIPVIFSYERRYKWKYDLLKEKSILDMDKNNNIYIIPEDGEHIKKLLRGEMLDVDINEINKKYFENNNNIKKIIIMPIISDYTLKGFVIFSWTNNFEITEEFAEDLLLFSDSIKNYVNYKTMLQSDIINSHKGSKIIDSLTLIKKGN